MKKLVKSLIFIVGMLFLNSCGTTKTCPDAPSPGNLSSPVNSQLNEISPRIFDNYFYSLIQEDENAKNPTLKLYKAKIKEYGTEPFVIDKDNPINTFDRASNFTYYKIDNKKYELFFSASNKRDGKSSNDIFSMFYENDNYSKPKLIQGKINTSNFESQPTVSSDGKLLVFSADYSDTHGKTDLYFSIKNSENIWQKPINIDKLNTENQETSPFLDDSLNLYYVTSTKDNGLEIVKSQYLGDYRWDEPIVLPYPINSNKNDITPAIYNKKIYLASDRENGCGGYDIYSFPICNKVIVTGEVNFGKINVSTNGKIKVYNQEKLFRELNLDESDKFRFSCPAGENYTIKYENPCFKNYFFEKKFFAPCNETTVYKINLVITLPDEIKDFSIEQYDVPFFVSGYYMPNTTENLEDLKLKFTYNLLGNSDSTKFIENPGKEYDFITGNVDRAINESVDFINSLLGFVGSDCSTGSEELDVTVTGYADPRPISKTSRYPGLDIKDKEFDITVLRGTEMDNDLLSLLRAYFTAKLIESKVSKSSNYDKMKSKINWIIKGNGSNSENAEEYKLLRKVSIEFNLKQ